MCFCSLLFLLVVVGNIVKTKGGHCHYFVNDFFLFYILFHYWNVYLMTSLLIFKYTNYSLFAAYIYHRYINVTRLPINIINVTLYTNFKKINKFSGYYVTVKCQLKKSIWHFLSQSPNWMIKEIMLVYRLWSVFVFSFCFVL